MEFKEHEGDIVRNTKLIPFIKYCCKDFKNFNKYFSNKASPINRYDDTFGKFEIECRWKFCPFCSEPITYHKVGYNKFKEYLKKLAVQA